MTGHPSTTLSTFRSALLDGAAPVPDNVQDGAGAPAGRRYDVYRNNVSVALRDALRASFPVLVKLIGDQNFDMLAGLFLRSHPPSSPLMMFYGGQMPDFLDGFAPLAHIGYLPDVARLEIAIRESYHAADSTAMNPGRFAEVPAEALNDATLLLAPHLRVIPSEWPLHDIWRFNMVSGAEKPRNIAQSVLILRREFDPEPHAITAADTAWLSITAKGGSMGDAQDAAAAVSPDYDLGPLLTLLIQNNALTDLTTKD
ncbi:hypothetical protein ASD8599_02703 [Ascidiaceihabitans donghaensis]|uniref:Putative DNA-binding domain-containing protein n=1 Tax=Ascidiaceihabitans donghaensis TaxID=1510460 RepID=A0A2R8BFU2_9RHOB|nr:DNA-binding domain-containing protein [Ascidiaceihabitans donghaensis]SPH21957.1 hypothetical protein ASD8599_02703 [Ascidiaceihabitans donghaensis]